MARNLPGNRRDGVAGEWVAGGGKLLSAGGAAGRIVVMIEYGGFSYPTLSPYVFYEDLAGALAFLAAAFGFTERLRNENPDGSLSHCEMAAGDSVIMLGTPPDYRNPAHSGSITVGMHVHVDDVDAHYARAIAAGATAQGAPVDQSYGVRSYGALDPEGHQWWFAQPI